MAARDVLHFIAPKPEGACLRVEVKKCHASRVQTILYPVGTAIIVTIDIDLDLSFVTKRDTNEQAI